MDTLPPAIEVTAPSRLHFGLLSFGGNGRQFGGAGVMIDDPQTRIRLHAANEFEVRGERASRVQSCVEHWAKYHRRDIPRCRIDVVTAPPPHIGLGSGTQFALSVVAGLNALFGLGNATACELAQSAGRGLRSAVGTYGFVEGGLIVERGKLPDKPISPLDCRVELPGQWRFVLVRPTAKLGLSGADEQAAFDSIPQVPRATTEQLANELRLQLVPAALAADFDAFSASLYRYGHQAGLCFESEQGGAYNGAELNELVSHMRSMGVQGVGQSSWGPTLFALLPDQHAATSFAADLRNSQTNELEISITSPNNSGARLVR